MRDLIDMTPAFQLPHLIQFMDSGMEKNAAFPSFPRSTPITIYETKFTFAEEWVKDLSQNSHISQLCISRTSGNNWVLSFPRNKFPSFPSFPISI